ncbi:MAG: gliding motility-associated C-terminal domain-containing protein [Cytophagales bacterium]|nr:gliding motility-associated C-terminal domain-containing protein [Cytophagales bacterium]
MLVELGNDVGDTGTFGSSTASNSSCPNSQPISGYYFEDNSGLAFVDGTLISTEYTIGFTFNLEELLIRSSRTVDWVHLLSFDHVNDEGIYIRVSTEGNGTLTFWENDTNTADVSSEDYFNTTDYYQLIITRESSETIKIYLDGNELRSFDDSDTQLYFPTMGSIVFFRDRPTSLLDQEASPGFVSSILIADYAWTASEVSDSYSDQCDLLVEPTVSAINLCFPDETTFNLTNDVSSADSVVWDFGDMTSSTTSATETEVTHSYLSEGTFNVVTSVYYGTLATVSVTSITIENIPDIDLGGDVSATIGDTVVLDASSVNGSYLWSDGSTEPTLSVAVGGTYSVQVTTDGGCVASDLSTVTFEYINLDIPNLFSPNNDGINDVWVIEGIETYAENEVTIFDRLGNELMFFSSYANDWDGTTSHGHLDEGTYFYRINLGIYKSKVGSVTILR